MFPPQSLQQLNCGGGVGEVVGKRTPTFHYFAMTVKVISWMNTAKVMLSNL